MRRCRRWSDVFRGTLPAGANPAQDNPNSMPDNRCVLQIPPADPPAAYRADMYRVIQWATGGVGRAAIQAVLRHPELELAGCWVHSADKDGRDAAELAGEDPIGVAATCDVQALLDTDADCVMYSPLLPDDAVVAAILRSGKNVVTPVGWVYPDRQNPAVRAIEDAAVAGDVTLHGSGIHPGGITERFPLMVSALSSGITHVRAEEYSDLRTYNSPLVVREVMGFGLTPERAMAGPMAALLEAGFKASVRMVADELGFDTDPGIRSTQEIAVAVNGSDDLIVPMEPGTVAARRFRWEAVVDGRPVVTAAVNWLMCEVDLTWIRPGRWATRASASRWRSPETPTCW